MLLRPPPAVGSYWTSLRPPPVRPLTWATDTASLPATPAARPVNVRLPPVPAIVTLVPPVAAPTVICPVPGAPPVCWTRPAVPLVRLVIAVVLPATLLLVAVSWPTLTASVGATPAATFDSVCAVPGAAPLPPGAINARLFAVAVRWTVPAAPVLRLVIAVVFPATVALVAASWLPLTASVDAGVSAPAATL